MYLKEKFLRQDCNCDGKLDCKDRLAIHLNLGKECINPYFSIANVNRFNTCARKIGVALMKEEDGTCEVAPE